jgi:hypothetical protein
MTPDGVLEWTKAVGILGAILLGGFAVFSPSWVWLRLRLFGWGGAMLCGFGTVLLVSPIFRNIQFVVDTKRLELKLSALESQLSQVHETVATITANLDKRDTVSFAHVDELSTKLEGIQKTVTALGTAIPDVSSLDSRIKGFEQTAAEIDKNVKALSVNYWTGLLSAPSNSDYAWQSPSSDTFMYKMAYDSKGIKFRPFGTAGYPLSIPAPDSASLSEYNKLMEALVKVPEYQRYIRASQKTEPGVMKWVDFDSPKGKSQNIP